jgi:hypothetical protein
MPTVVQCYSKHTTSLMEGKRLKIRCYIVDANLRTSYSCCKLSTCFIEV